MNISIFRYALTLILISLVAAFFVPVTTVPRLALSAHTIGVLSGVLLIAIGAIWQHFQLTHGQRLGLQWSWIYSSYANWLGCLVGAIFGAGRMTPVASAGLEGAALPEAVVSGLLGTAAIVSLVAVALSLWGLRPRPILTAQQDAPADKNHFAS